MLLESAPLCACRFSPLYQCHQVCRSRSRMNGTNDNRMSEGPPAPRRGLRRAWQGLKRAVPFASGVLAALAALLLYRALFPPAQPLTTAQLQDVIGQTMASATPPPPFSALVYGAIQPSLVLIETQSGSEDGLGSGVVVDDAGDILTALHVVDGAAAIRIT